MPKSTGVQTLGSALEALIDSMKIRSKIDAVRIVEAWAALAGPQINGVTDSARVKGRTLHVQIRSSAWRHELHRRRSQWRDHLNLQLGEALVEEIVFR